MTYDSYAFILDHAFGSGDGCRGWREMEVDQCLNSLAPVI